MKNFIRRFFLLGKEEQALHTYFWSAISTVTYCGVTFVLLALITQILTPYWGGVFSLAFAISQQLLIIGCFNVRPYQSSDVQERFDFGDYFISRLMTVFLMIVAGAVWIIADNQVYEKVLAIIWIGLLKVAESFSDVFEGQYQRRGRFDTASKGNFYKTFLSLLCFIVTLCLSKSLILSLCVLTVSYVMLLLMIDGVLIRSFTDFKLRFNLKKQYEIVVSCFPLFLTSFLIMYINNVAKFKIDKTKGEVMLAEYNAMFMFLFLIAMMCGIFLRPVIQKMAEAYRVRNEKAFYKITGLQMLWLGLFSFCGLVGAYFLGIPVLSLVYPKLNLLGYKKDLMVLFLGGAMFAVYQLVHYVLVIIRRQTVCLLGVIFSAAVGAVITPRLVSEHSIFGASLSYCITMSILAIITTASAIWFTRYEFKN